MLWLLSLQPRDEALSCLRPADYDMQPSNPIPAQIGFACADRQASARRFRPPFELPKIQGMLAILRRAR